MCEPTTLALGGLALGAASGVAGFASQSQQASAVNRNSYMQGLMNNMALAQTYNQLGNERVNERNAASTELFNDRIKAAQASATAQTAAGAAGVDGSQSLQNIMQDYGAQGGRIEGAVDRNYQMQSDSIQAREESSFLGTVAHNNALPRAAQPSPLSLGLSIAGAGMNAAGSYYRYTNNATQTQNAGSYSA